MDNLINGLSNPGAQVICSSHSTHLNPGKIIPGLQHADLILVTTSLFSKNKGIFHADNKIVGLGLQKARYQCVYIVKFRLGMQLLLWLGYSVMRRSVKSGCVKTPVVESFLHTSSKSSKPTD